VDRAKLPAWVGPGLGGVLARLLPIAPVVGATPAHVRYDVAAVASRIEFSFPEYVAARKGDSAARLREGAAYAYGADLKLRTTLDKLKPVSLAMEAAVRFWHAVGKNRLLGDAIRVGDKQFPGLHALLGRCVDALQIRPPTLYVSPKIPIFEAHTFGTSEEAAIVLGSALPDHLSEAEMVSMLGHECGRIQNSHTVYLTTLYFLANAGLRVVRWAAHPAILALRSWARRAEITSDRASLLCSRDLTVSKTALVKLALRSHKLYTDVNMDEYLRQLDEAGEGPGRVNEYFETHPQLPTRVKALGLFAETTFYKSVVGGPGGAAAPGLTKEECDAKVAELLSVF
jgi:Zn-dependent protease with chaperone function